MDVTSENSLARVAAYQALSWGFVYPTVERLAHLLAWQTTLSEAFAVLGLPADEVTTALAAIGNEQATRLQTFQVEYTRLFINAVPQVLAPPYASAYVNGGLLMGQPAEAALRAYRQAGLAFSTATHDLPDHLAAELEFMFYLGQKELAAREEDDHPQADRFRDYQRRFLNDHLLPWVPAWQARVDGADRTGFYRALARLTEAWLRTDAAHLVAQSNEKEAMPQ